jgi:pSer/pThr/pTyr-binding forkhead associated (FHA) protein
MLDLVILALRIVMVALLYFFLVLVLRMANQGLRPPVTASRRSQNQHMTLLVLEPGHSNLTAGQVIEVGDGTTLGRAERADVVLADAAVSSAHARLNRVGRAWVVTDLESTNGTRVNETRVNGNTPLTDGDVLALGTVRLQVRAH